MTEKETTITLTSEELAAVIGWAGMAGVGFVFGGVADPNDTSVRALKKLQDAQR